MITKNSVALAADATLRARGLRLTRQRRIILEVVRATDAHPTAAFVYRRVRRRLPRVSLATVYRNLRTLAAEGFVAERADPSGARFDDVPPRADRAVRARVATRTGFEVLNHRTEFYGRCVACRRHGRRSPSRD